MVKPIPDNVKEILSQLSSSQQVVLRSYIATLRSEIVTFEEEALNADNKDDANAHYHGDVKCTADHGHVDTEHVDHHHEHVHTEHCQHEHDHKDTHGAKESHDHHEHEHEHTQTDHGHDHKEKHHDHDHDHHGEQPGKCCEQPGKCCEKNVDTHVEKHNDEGHAHKHHAHSENCEHDHKEHDHHTEHDHHHDVPAWKKAALSADPTAAPFGGNWHSESNISAKDESDKAASSAMEE